MHINRRPTSPDPLVFDHKIIGPNEKHFLIFIKPISAVQLRMGGYLIPLQVLNTPAVQVARATATPTTTANTTATLHCYINKVIWMTPVFIKYAHR